MPHANAPLTERAGCAWPAASSRTAGRFAGPPNDSRSRSPTAEAVGGPVPRVRRRPGWSTGPAARIAARPNQTPRPLKRKIMHLRTHKRLGPGPDRRPSSAWTPSTVHRVLHPSRDCRSLALTRPGHRGSRSGARRHAATSTPSPGVADARRHQEARQHPRRRRLARPRPRLGNRNSRPTETRSDPQGPRPPEPRLQLPAHRRRRPLPAGLHARSCPTRPAETAAAFWHRARDLVRRPRASLIRAGC